MALTFERMQLGNVIRFGNGKAIKPGGIGRYPVFGSNGIIGHSDEFRYENGIIIGRVGAYCGSVEFCPARFWASDNTLVAFPANDQFDTSFLYYLLHNAKLSAYAGGAAQPLVTQTVLKQVEVNVPPLPAQRRIAGILSAYDELIENNQRRIRILEDMARSLYREWFVHFHYPGHESVPLVDSPLGQIPQGWEVSVVEDVLKRVPSGKKYDQKSASPIGTVPILDQGKSGIIGYHDDEPGVCATEDNPIIVFANHTCYQRLILFPFSAIQNVLPFVPNPSLKRDIYWLHWATNGLIVFNDYKGHWPEFIAKELVVPPPEISERFGCFASPITREILKLERAIENLRSTRDLLLPRLLSGQVQLDDVTLP